MNSWKLRAFIYQCKDLPSADDDGGSDPFIEFWSPDKKKVLTPVVEDNNNPIFFATLEIFYDFLSKEEAPPLIMNIWDKDEGMMDSTDDFLGRAIIDLRDAAISEDDSVPMPTWHKVVGGFDADAQSIGEILCSFSCVPDDFSY